MENVDGILTKKDQVRDYMYRGDGLERYNFLDLFLNTYDGLPVNEGVDEDDREPSRLRRGPRTHQRFPYREGSGKGRRCRVIRSEGHETVPQFIGQWFPRNDRADEEDFYYASMLALFSPWRIITDIKASSSSWKEAFDSFKSSASSKQKDMLLNIQYFHECSDGAAARSRDPTLSSGGLLTMRQMQSRAAQERVEVDAYRTFTEWDVEHARSSRETEQLYLYCICMEMPL